MKYTQYSVWHVVICQYLLCDVIIIIILMPILK